nr:MAG TPA: hypothetical protein [Caudoviricetes sp.]
MSCCCMFSFSCVCYSPCLSLRLISFYLSFLIIINVITSICNCFGFIKQFISIIYQIFCTGSCLIR